MKFCLLSFPQIHAIHLDRWRPPEGVKFCFKVVMDDNAFWLNGYAEFIQTIQKIVPGLFSTWAFFNTEELDFFHWSIIVEKS